MTLNFHQRMSHGLTVNASYTWAHTLDVSDHSNERRRAHESVLVEGRITAMRTGTSGIAC